MYVIFFLIFIQFCVFLASLVEEKTKKYNYAIYITFGLLLVLFAGFREIGADKDSIQYQEYFLNPSNPIFSVEYTFFYISEFLYNYSSDVHILFVVYALIAISIKFFFFRKFSDSFYLPVIIYIGYFFMMQEMTQIRAGVATALVLPIILLIAEKQRFKAFLVMLIAISFHYSALTILPMLFLSNKDMSPKKRWLLSLVVPLSYLIHFIGAENIYLSLDIPYLGEKLKGYQMLRDRGLAGDKFNVFSVPFVAQVLLYYYVIYYYDIIIKRNKYLPIMIQMATCFILIYLNFSFIPVIAYRISDFYAITNIFLYTNIAYTVNPRWLGNTIVYFAGLAQLLISIYVTELLNPST